MVHAWSKAWASIEIHAISTDFGAATAGPGMIAANVSGKLNLGAAILMISLSALAGIAAIFPSFRKP